eukprot:TRINITY_DN340_c0_g1_i5.p1 TRINITY_DN340_c0_g1~~TRINITY_DN340_c0_g1_i5.p1  ORF type:complete len:1157 (-),score=418.97 TRINITY_DN340_c0_g1_i5:34-3504(-)
MAEEPKGTTWVHVQQKTFTRWGNQFLAERLLKMDDLVEDLKDGVKLCELLEIISSKSVGKFNRSPKLRYHFLENVRFALEFIKREGLTLVGIGPEDIVDGKIKLDLGLMWTIILRYHINVIGKGSPKWELLQWVRQQIEPYNVEKKGDQLKNFTTDWQDGTVLFALADSLEPGILTPYDMSKLARRPLVDAQKAMDTAEEAYDIPKLLDAEDLVNNPDELSMMTYISYFRDFLSDEANRRRLDAERRRITAHPALCFAFGPGLAGGDAHSELTFTIQAVNCNGDKLTTGGCEFDVAVAGPGTPQVKVTDNNDGTYSVVYSVDKGGNFTIAVRLVGQKGISELPTGHPGWGQHIKDSPFSAVITGAGAGNSYAKGPGVEGAVVNKPALFTIFSVTADGRPCTGGGAPFKAKVGGVENVGDVPITDNGDGTYTGQYQVSKPGPYQVDITLDGQPIKNSPYKLLIENANAGNSWAEGPGLEKGQQNHEAVFTIHAVGPDGSEVKSGGDPFLVTISGPENIEVTPKDNNDGTYTVSYVPRKYGNYNIGVTLHGSPIKDAPFSVPIKSAPDAGKSWAEGPGLEGAFPNEPAKFTIHAVDGDGKPRNDGGDQFDVVVKGPNGPVPVTVTDNGDGTYDVTYDPSAPGDYDVDVTYEGDHIKDAPFKVSCEKRPADAANTYAHGPGLEPGNETNQPLKFEIVTKNVHDEPLDFGGNKFDVQVAGPDSNVPVQVVDNNDGTYDVTYEVSKPGDYVVSVKLDGKDIKNTPAKVSIAGPAADNSYATGPGVEGAVAREPAPFRITAVDGNGNPLKTGNDPFVAKVTGPEAVGDVPLTDNGDGTYDGVYQVNTPGEYTVDITLDGKPIKDAPFKVLIENARASLSYAEGPGLEGGQQFKEGVFTIYAVDTRGNKLSVGGDPFKVEITGVEQLSPKVVDNNNGTYSVSYVPKQHGDHTITVTLHSENIKSSPFSVNIKPAPNAGNSWAEGPGLDEAWDNEPAYFTIHAVDGDGNPRSDGGDVFDVKINGPEEVVPQVVDNGDGTYSVTYEPKEPGNYTINVDLEGSPIKNSPFKVKCKEGTDADNSGFGIFSFTIQARDKRGKEKTFGGDNFEVNIKGPDAEIEVQTLDNGDGTYTAIYALAGEDIKGKSFNIIATLNGKNVGKFTQNM